MIKQCLFQSFAIYIIIHVLSNILLYHDKLLMVQYYPSNILLYHDKLLMVQYYPSNILLYHDKLLMVQYYPSYPPVRLVCGVIDSGTILHNRFHLLNPVSILIDIKYQNTSRVRWLVWLWKLAVSSHNYLKIPPSLRDEQTGSSCIDLLRTHSGVLNT